MSIRNIVEKVNKENVEFLLSLNEDEFENICWTSSTDTDTHDEFSCSLKKGPYLNNFKKYLKLQLANDCCLSVKYDFSKEMKTNGRLFSKVPGSLQGIKKRLRGFLVEGVKDVDIVNAHPRILQQICIEHFFNGDKSKFKEEYPHLFYLNKNRTSCLRQMECSKNDIIVMLNSKYITKSENQHRLKLDNEFKKIQNIIYNHTPEGLKQYEHFKVDNKRNRTGSFLNRLLCIHENMIIQEVVDYYDKNHKGSMSTLVFDGFHLSDELPDQIKTLNLITEKYGVEWSYKTFNNSIYETDLYKERSGLPKYELKDYKSVKEKLERTAFMIRDPIMFGQEYFIKDKKHVGLYSSSDFQILIKPYTYEKFIKGTIQSVSIHSDWIADKDHRSYKQMDFIPTHREFKEIYNTFNGFVCEDYKDTEFVHCQEMIDMFIKHIGILVNNEAESIDYVIKYFADLIQHPDVLPEVALVFKSEQGFGKDMFITTISNMLGSEYILRTAKPDEIVGQFNGLVKNKLLVQMNEMEGKDGFALKEKIKNFITEARTTINEKNMKPYTQTNYTRNIYCTNSSRPLEIPHGDRRFTVFEAQRMKPSQEYFSRYWELIYDKNALYTLYKYLMEFNIQGFSLRHNRPITNAYKKMAESCIHPFYYFMNEVFEIKEFNTFGDGNFIVSQKDSNIMLVSPQGIFNAYKEHLTSMNQLLGHFKQAQLVGLLGQIDVLKVVRKVNGSSVKWYKVNITNTAGLLTTMCDMDQEEIEEFI